MHSNALARNAFVALALGGSASVATVGPPYVGGYATVYAPAVPPDIGRYPHVYYEGGYAYLVDGAWYYPTTSGWVVLTQEPPPLARYRAYLRGAAAASAAPPAPTYQYGPHAAPPRRYAPLPQYGYPAPPPATPVR
jgi:hypothetical protein